MMSPTLAARLAALILACVPHFSLCAQEPATTKATKDAPSPAVITRPKALLPDSPLVNMTLIGKAASDPDYFIWCTSPIQDTDGKVHLFCSRWPNTEKKMKPWTSQSEVVRYVGDGPEGPFKLANVVLPANPGAPWNNTKHNPAITKAGNIFVLTYITYDLRPEANPRRKCGLCMATSKSLSGPWTIVKGINPETQPGLIVQTSSDPNHWTFPARGGFDNQNLLVHEGKFYLYFKIMGASSKATAKHTYGVAVADKLEGPYVLSAKPVTDNIAYIEDATSFFWDGKFNLLTTDNFGKNSGIYGAGILWQSDTPNDFKLANAKIGFLLPQDYWNPPIDMKKLGKPKGSLKFERPGILMQKSRPAYFYAPPGDSPDGEERTSSYVFKINLPTFKVPSAQP
jgi:hypothetical protein